MRITDIKQQVKNPQRYSVFVDDSYAFSLSENALLESGYRVGQELDDEELESARLTATEDKAYNSALAMIARRPRSEWEIGAYLKRKGYDKSQIDKTIRRLKERHYLDDAAFATAWIANRRLLKATSSRRLQQELRQKRVPDVIIERSLEKDDTDEQAVLRELIERKQSQTRYKDKTKLMQYLARQGFSYGDIKSALEEQAD